MRIELDISNIGGRKPLSIGINLLHDNESDYPRDKLLRFSGSLDEGITIKAEVGTLVEAIRSGIYSDSAREQFDYEIISAAKKIKERSQHPDEEET